MAVFGSSWLLD